MHLVLPSDLNYWGLISFQTQISKHKNDVEQVNVNFTMCIETAKQKYPFAKIGIVVFCLEEAKVSTPRL
jgi:hypothetical protein